jgi:hypothetical protein
MRRIFEGSKRLSGDEKKTNDMKFFFQKLRASISLAAQYRGSRLGMFWAFVAEWKHNSGLLKKGINPFDYSDAQ